MKQCWEVDYANRPTFKDLVPKIETLVSENHKQVSFLDFVKILLNRNKTPFLARSTTLAGKKPLQSSGVSFTARKNVLQT
jgi:hypothetical protein